VSAADDRAAVFLRWVTYLRVVLTPVVVALVLAGPKHSRAFAAAGACFAVAAITDFVDGRLARRWKQITALGTFMDTTADKLLVSGTLIALVAVDRASAWIGVVIIGRELLVLGLKGAASAVEGEPVGASALGKAKANLQFLSILLVLIRPDVRVGDVFVDQIGLVIAAVVTVWSGLDYVGHLSGRLTRARDRR
jgi:CDP-diacylglycerol--glycerol-3-phosphate 3-phosphatidyltransferase